MLVFGLGASTGGLGTAATGVGAVTAWVAFAWLVPLAITGAAGGDFEIRMRGVFDFQQQVPAHVPLPREPDNLAGLHALGHAHVQGPAVDADAHAAAFVDGLQRHRQLRSRASI